MVHVKVKTKLGAGVQNEEPKATDTLVPSGGPKIKTIAKGAKIDLLKRQKENNRTFKVSKGMKADELLTALKEDFIEHGMDAYK